MAYTAIHPHKGYLNSLFKIYTDSKSPQTYVVCEKSDGSVRMPIVQGTINSNEPHEFKVTKPGLYTVHFEDETDIDIVVELEKPTMAVMYDLRENLKKLFGCNVDLVRFRESLRPMLKNNILNETIYV